MAVIGDPELHGSRANDPPRLDPDVDTEWWLDEPERHGSGASDACRADADVETEWWLHRDRQLGQCLPSRSWHHRLLRGEGGVDEFLQGAVQGSWSQRDSDEHGESRSSRNG